MRIGTRLEVFAVFLKIGALGFGIAAIWGLIQAEVQERRNWLSKERFVEGMALVQALPGATALQMCIFTGYQRAGLAGGILAGVGFILPAFAIMLALTALHSAYGALPFLRDAFYGLGPVVLGVFAVAVWRLGRNAIKDRFSVVVSLAAIAALAFTPLGPAGTFLLAGCIGVAAHHSLRAGLTGCAVVLALAGADYFFSVPLASPAAAGTGLWDIGLFFFKVGALTFGGGLTIITFIQDQVVNQLQWISSAEFLEGLAIGQVTPGPVITLAAFVGYKVAGVAGAAVATGAIFIPSGPAPAGGRHIIAWAHPTSGVAPACAPSLYPQALTWIPGLEDMLARGYVVAATDFPGLGTAGVHPYLIGESSARAVLDAGKPRGIVAGDASLVGSFVQQRIMAYYNSQCCGISFDWQTMATPLWTPQGVPTNSPLA